MQKLTLIGCIGKEAQTKQSSNGRYYVTFSVAANYLKNGEKKTAWYDVVWFNFTPNLVPFLVKGKYIVVVGELETDLYIDSNGSTFITRRIMADYVGFTTVNGPDKTNDEAAKANTRAAEESDLAVTSKHPKTAEKKEDKKEDKKEVVVSATAEDDENDLPF